MWDRRKTSTTTAETAGNRNIRWTVRLDAVHIRIWNYYVRHGVGKVKKGFFTSTTLRMGRRKNLEEHTEPYRGCTILFNMKVGICTCHVITSSYVGQICASVSSSPRSPRFCWLTVYIMYGGTDRRRGNYGKWSRAESIYYFHCQRWRPHEIVLFPKYHYTHTHTHRIVPWLSSAKISSSSNCKKIFFCATNT